MINSSIDFSLILLVFPTSFRLADGHGLGQGGGATGKAQISFLRVFTGDWLDLSPHGGCRRCFWGLWRAFDLHRISAFEPVGASDGNRPGEDLFVHFDGLRRWFPVGIHVAS